MLAKMNLKIGVLIVQICCIYFVNTLYFMINRVFCFVGEENGVNYLKIDKGNKKVEDSILSIWNTIFSRIKYNIKKINHKC